MSKDYKKIEGMCRDFEDKAKVAYDRGYSQGYEDGMKEAWECAEWICETEKQKLLEAGLTQYNKNPDLNEYEFSCNVISDNTAVNMIEKKRAWEEKIADDEMKIGDEVICYQGDKAAVVNIGGEKYPYNVLYDNGDAEWLSLEDIKGKTGRHFDQIEEVLKLMKGEE